jgi:hypothetical protein
VILNGNTRRTDGEKERKKKRELILHTYYFIMQRAAAAKTIVVIWMEKLFIIWMVSKTLHQYKKQYEKRNNMMDRRERL